MFAIVGTSTTNAQITYLPGSSITAPVWTADVSPVEQGNGVYISPDGAIAVVVSKDASVEAFDSFDGTNLWTVKAPTSTAKSFGGAFFCYGAESPYILYSYVDANVRYGQTVPLSIPFTMNTQPRTLYTFDSHPTVLLLRSTPVTAPSPTALV